MFGFARSSRSAAMMTGPVMPSPVELMKQRSALPLLELDTADVPSPSPVHNDNRTALQHRDLTLMEHVPRQTLPLCIYDWHSSSFLIALVESSIISLLNASASLTGSLFAANKQLT